MSRKQILGTQMRSGGLQLRKAKDRFYEKWLDIQDAWHSTQSMTPKYNTLISLDGFVQWAAIDVIYWDRY
jgi:hypothetical protein